MKAAVLHNFGVPLSVEQVTDPAIGTGEVLVDVVAAPVLSYTGEVLSGARRYLLPTPVVPGAGAIGRVRAVGPDATRLRPGDWVFCDPTVRSRDGAPTPDITLQGASARGEGGQKLQRYFRDGTFAEQVRVPTENAAPIGTIDPAEAGRWCSIGTLLIAYGGLLAMDFRPGRNAVGEWSHRQLRLGYRGVGAGDGRTLRGGAGSQRPGAGRPAPALRRAPEAGAADGRCGSRHAGDARGGTRADRRGAGFPASLGQRRRGARRHYDAATGR